MDSKEKHVDESWKEQASEEKEKLAGSDLEQESREPQGHVDQAESDSGCGEDCGHDHAHDQEVEVNFLNYVTSLGFQAMIFMGEIPNPVSNKTEKNLVQSKFLIDTLAMLKDKTVGNLTDQEKQFLENTIYELQLRYVQISKGGDAQTGEIS